MNAKKILFFIFSLSVFLIGSSMKGHTLGATCEEQGGTCVFNGGGAIMCIQHSEPGHCPSFHTFVI